MILLPCVSSPMMRNSEGFVLPCTLPSFGCFCWRLLFVALSLNQVRPGLLQVLGMRVRMVCLSEFAGFGKAWTGLVMIEVSRLKALKWFCRLCLTWFTGLMVFMLVWLRFGLWTGFWYLGQGFTGFAGLAFELVLLCGSGFFGWTVGGRFGPLDHGFWF